MENNSPVYGCDECKTTGGRMSCFKHSSSFTPILPKQCKHYYIDENDRCIQCRKLIPSPQSVGQ